VAILDDDGQNPPREIDRMLKALQSNGWDVVYGRYVERHHPWHRRLGSRFNDAVATALLGKPRHLYLSSFKVMNRFLVDELIWAAGPSLYLDGLILRITKHIGQVDVVHLPRQRGRSGYTLWKLFSLWLNMVLGSSILPLRCAIVMGLIAAGGSLLVMAGVLVEKLCLNTEISLGIPSILMCVVFFAGVQLVVLGAVAEYVGRVFQHQNGAPQFVVRAATPGTSRRDPTAVSRSSAEIHVAT
jgi:undecaprenyl-phosphate 4-deoxy-4-formamido-L-arabinose transferase